MPTWYDTLFYCVFLAQIVLISLYYPERLRHRMLDVLSHHPPADYPRLYPKPVEDYRRRIRVFRLGTRCILVLGIALLLALATGIGGLGRAHDGTFSEVWPAAFGMLQFLPLLALEASEASQLKLMRQARNATRRRAELRPRRLFDFVPPTWLALAVLLLAGSIAFDLFVHDFDVSLEHDTMRRAMTLTVTNVFLVVAGAAVLRGRKANPHQSSGDRAAGIGVALKSQVFASLAVSALFVVLAAGDAFAMHYLDATLMSLYFQAIAIVSIGYSLRSITPEDIDFDVYRSDPTPT